MNESMLSKINKAGLSDKEARVYAALAELGGAFPSKIAEVTKLNRSTTYKLLLDLSVKGLVNEIKKKNKLFYQIEKPENLIRYAKGQVTIANDNLEGAQKLIPELEGLYSAFNTKPKITYYEGIEGILSIYTDHISVKKKYEMVAIAYATELEIVLPEKFFENYRRTKERIGITTRGIITDSVMNSTFVDRLYAGYKKEIIPEVRLVPAGKFPFKGEVTLYGVNKVSIVNFNKEHRTGLIIEDETIYNMMRTIFELAWKGAEK
jgi:HTH-type transcriptional regulator, sugar sensing transcriptional regulator